MPARVIIRPGAESKRLFLACAGIAALSLASGGVGWRILNDVETDQTTIVERAMPAVSDARLAAEVAGRIVARNPRLTNAATETERETEAAVLFRLAEHLQQALERNIEYGYSETELETLHMTAERLREDLSAQLVQLRATAGNGTDSTGRIPRSGTVLRHSIRMYRFPRSATSRGNLDKEHP